MTTPALSIHQPEAADARSLSDQAYYRIRELIVTLELPPGSLVSERELMERLGLGRTPVREALRALARERLVEVYPRRGMFVSSVDVRDLAGLSEVRNTLELPPGSPISERELMERLGLGRTPIREALRTLAQEQLVEVYPRRGMIVAPVVVGDLAALSEARRTLECLAARLAAERATEDDRAVARSLLEELPAVAAAGDERRLIELDQRIHRHVYRCTHNPFLSAALGEHYLLSLRIWFLALDRVEHLDEAVSEHGELLEAIRDGDGARAEQAMRRHVQGFEQAVRKAL